MTLLQVAIAGTYALQPGIRLRDLNNRKLPGRPLTIIGQAPDGKIELHDKDQPQVYVIERNTLAIENFRPMPRANRRRRTRNTR